MKLKSLSYWLNLSVECVANCSLIEVFEGE